MPESNAEVVAKLFADLADNDPQRALEIFDADVEWSPTEGT